MPRKISADTSSLSLFPDFPLSDRAHADSELARRTEQLADGAVILRSFAQAESETLWRDLKVVMDQAPLRQMFTPGGLPMSVDTTSCGQVGWISDRRGYRYSAIDPLSSRPWPAMPDSFSSLVLVAAQQAGFPHFGADSCLINRYRSGAKMSLHQDRDERDFSAPIVSVSLGVSAVFLFGGLSKTDRVQRVRLYHGDVVVFGGPSRLCYHGIAPIKVSDEAGHSVTGPCRINLTLRQAN